MDDIERLAYDASEAAAALGCSRQTIYDLINAGSLRSLKFGGRRFIPVAAIRELLDGATTDRCTPATEAVGDE